MDNDDRYLQYCKRMENRYNGVMGLPTALRMSAAEHRAYEVWVEEIRQSLPRANPLELQNHPEQARLKTEIPAHIPLKRWWREKRTPWQAAEWIIWHQRRLQRIAMLT